MLPADIRKKVASLWDLVSGAGLAASPYVALEQIACLIFLKRLDGMAAEPDEDGLPSIFQLLMPDDENLFDERPSFWNTLLQHQDPGSYLNGVVFPWLRELELMISDYPSLARRLSLNGMLRDAYFQLDLSKPQALKSLVIEIDKLFPYQGRQSKNGFSSGDVFEHLFTEASANSRIGPLVTARHITRFMVALLDPKPGQRIIDPAAGTGGLLVSALHYMLADAPGPLARSKRLAPIGEGLVGVDLSHALARIGWVNLLLHGIELPQFMQGNSLVMTDFQGPAQPLLSESFDFVLCDLPFGGRIDPEEAAGTQYLPSYTREDQVNQSDKIDLLFVWRALSLLKVGGSAALIIPQSLLYGSSKAEVELRRELLSRHHVEAVILLPGEIFNPYTGIEAAILVVRKVTGLNGASTSFSKEPKTDAVWFYEVTQDGYSMDHKRDELPAGADNDLFDALVHFRQRHKGEHVWDAGKERYFRPDTWQDASWASLDAIPKREATQLKQWLVPVRRWLQKPAWRLVNNKIHGSHDEQGQVRSAYVEVMQPRLYINDKLRPGLLDPHCIEGNDWSLDLEDYKVIEQPKPTEERSALELIDELEAIEVDVLERLRQLRKLIGEVQ
ncbi:N-6 DNA methylase [Pseudomonas sp. JDS08PS003]|uniref:class I SAM-dependent DNA methyltransferase n=1 Tax=Pseudomonas sp. JDS08PS003 TaxID=2497162 RepID=UPI003857D0E4